MSGTIIDAFRGDAFSAMTLTASVEKAPFMPIGLGAMNLFTPRTSYTTEIAVEWRNGKLSVIPTSQRGAPGMERETEQRKAKFFSIPRLKHGDTIFAHELQNVRAWNSPNGLVQLQDEVARRISGPTGIQANFAYTWERHRLGAVQGKLLDANGSVIYNYFTEFGITEPDVVNFDLRSPADGGPSAGYLRKKIAAAVRAIMRAAQIPDGVGRVVAICGDNFYDSLTTHPDVERTYQYQQEAPNLRQSITWQQLEFGGVLWINYRGSDDNSTIAIGADDCRFFPDAPGVFEVHYGPAEFLSMLNQPGKELMIVRDIDKSEEPAWVRFDGYSYPLHLCLRPEALRRGTISTTPSTP